MAGFFSMTGVTEYVLNEDEYSNPGSVRVPGTVFSQEYELTIQNASLYELKKHRKRKPSPPTGLWSGLVQAS